MSARDAFADYARRFIAEALERVPAELISDVYVVSLFVYDEGDDPLRPTVAVGFNTEGQVLESLEPGPPLSEEVAEHHREQLDLLAKELGASDDSLEAIREVMGDPVPSPAASDEARWNYAFWLRPDLGVLAGAEVDPQGAALRDEWIRSTGLWVNPDRFEEDLTGEEFDALVASGEKVTRGFVELIVDLVGDLHAEGVIETVFGRPLPVLVHELEYYEEIALQNLRANPDGLADDFVRWVAGAFPDADPNGT